MPTMLGAIIPVMLVPKIIEWSRLVVIASSGVTMVPPPMPRSPEALRKTTTTAIASFYRGYKKDGTE